MKLIVQSKKLWWMTLKLTESHIFQWKLEVIKSKEKNQTNKKWVMWFQVRCPPLGNTFKNMLTRLTELCHSHPWTSSCRYTSRQPERTVYQAPMPPVLARAHTHLLPPEAVNCSVSSLLPGPALALFHNELVAKRGLSSGWSWMCSGLPQGSDDSGWLRY